ncbi:hypothetical protein ACN47E_003115 [Coniothyrium glycines]
MPANTFDLPGWEPALKVTVSDGIDLDRERAMAFPALANWVDTMKKNLAVQEDIGSKFANDPWQLHEVKIHNVTVFANGKIGFMTIEAMLKTKGGKPLDRVVFLRGGSVAVLMILRPRDSRNERYVILTEQPRIGACSTAFLEIPAGMLDDKSGDVTGAAMKEIEEETGLKVHRDELIDLTELALRETETKEDLQPAMYPSPANLDEYIPLLLWEKDLDRKEIEGLRGKLTGERAKDEFITLRVSEYDILWKEGARDAKTLAAWALYEGLNRAGKIEERLKEIRTGSRPNSTKR